MQFSALSVISMAKKRSMRSLRWSSIVYLKMKKSLAAVLYCFDKSTFLNEDFSL